MHKNKTVYTKIHFSKSENRNARVCVYMYMCVLFGAFGVSNKFTHVRVCAANIYCVFYDLFIL